MPQEIISAASAQFARPGDTTAYADNDLIANSVTAASVVPLVFRFATNARFLQIDRALLRKSSTGVTNPAFRLNLFSALPTIATNGDNSAMSGNTSGAANFIGGLQTSGVVSAFADGSVVNLLPMFGASPFPLPLLLPTNGFINNGELVLYGLLEAKAAYAPGNAETFNVTLFARPLQ